MYEKIEECPICKHTHFENHLICEDYTTSGESFALGKCKKCSTILTNPRPDEQSLPSYYKSEDYISHTNSARSITQILYKLVRSYTLRKKVRLCEQVNGTPGSLLDFGCGTGHFLSKANQMNWNAYGYEIDPNASEIARKQNPGKVISDLEKTDQKFDIITAWHVLEHVNDLKKTIKQLRKLLNENGHMIIALPNHQSYDASIYKEHWAAYDVPRHLYHFNKTSILEFCRRFKFTLINTVPMVFDSYYVSLLSERYRKGSFINAFKNGYLSNKKARKSGEYSSLIYVLKK